MDNSDITKSSSTNIIKEPFKETSQNSRDSSLIKRRRSIKRLSGTSTVSNHKVADVFDVLKPAIGTPVSISERPGSPKYMTPIKIHGVELKLEDSDEEIRDDDIIIPKQPKPTRLPSADIESSNENYEPKIVSRSPNASPVIRSNLISRNRDHVSVNRDHVSVNRNRRNMTATRDMSTQRYKENEPLETDLDEEEKQEEQEIKEMETELEEEEQVKEPELELEVEQEEEQEEVKETEELELEEEKEQIEELEEEKLLTEDKEEEPEEKEESVPIQIQEEKEEEKEKEQEEEKEQEDDIFQIMSVDYPVKKDIKLQPKIYKEQEKQGQEKQGQEQEDSDNENDITDISERIKRRRSTKREDDKKLETTKQELEEIEKHKKDLENKLNKDKKLIEDAQKNIEKAKKEAENHKKQSILAQQEIEKIKKEVDEAKRLLSRVNEENERLDRELNSKARRLEDTSQRTVEFEKLSLKAKDEIEQAKKEIDSYKIIDVIESRDKVILSPKKGFRRISLENEDLPIHVTEEPVAKKNERQANMFNIADLPSSIKNVKNGQVLESFVGISRMVPEYSKMSPELQYFYRQNFILKINAYKRIFTHEIINPEDESLSLEKLHVATLVYERHAQVNLRCNQYRVSLVMVWYAIQLLCWWLGIAHSDFAQKQIENCAEYEIILLELSDRDIGPSAIVRKESLQWKLVKSASTGILIFAIVQILSKWLPKSMVEGSLDSIFGYFTGTRTGATNKMNLGENVRGIHPNIAKQTNVPHAGTGRGVQNQGQGFVNGHGQGVGQGAGPRAGGGDILADNGATVFHTVRDIGGLAQGFLNARNGNNNNQNNTQRQTQQEIDENEANYMF